MRRLIIPTFIWLWLIIPIALSAQEKLISGTVTDDKGEPVPFATVTIKGTKKSVVSSELGRFSIKISSSTATLIITSTGYETKEVETVAGADVKAELLSSGTLSEVVVTTAFGLKQKKRATAYSVQEINSTLLDKGKENNVINALQGKIGGVNITSTGGAAGSGTEIIIRGLSSLSASANNQPLIVIDGLPVNNSTNVASVVPSTGSNGLAAGSNDQFAFANRALDVNPADIESISVLKGAGATALYGLNGANGVIIITTKKGKQGKTSISYNNSYSFDFLTKWPEIQTTYREGSSGRVNVNFDGSPGSKFQTFGPVNTAADPIYNNFKNAFVTGHRLNNTIALQGGNEKATYYSSVSALNQDGILKYTDFNRYTFKIGGSYQASAKLNITGSASLISSKTVSPSAGDKGVMTSLSYHTPTYDVRDYMYADGSMKVYSPGVIDNPLYVARYSQAKSNLQRFFGQMGFIYSILPKLKFDYKIGGDFYGDNLTRIVPGPRYSGDPTTLDLAIANGGFVVEDRVTFRDVNSNAILTWSDKINKDITYSLLAGTSVQVTYRDRLNTRGEKFALPGFYDLSNTTTLYTSRSTTQRKYAGIFGSAKFEYKNALFLELTGRNDWSSTLPYTNNSFFYPSANLSYVFTDLHHIKSYVLNFGKLRLSYSQVGKDAPIENTGTYYSSVSGFPFTNSSGTSIPGFWRNSSFFDPNLKPEMQKSFEIGTELHFLKDKITLDITAYKNRNEDQIIPVPISYTAGYSSYVTNAGTLENKGLEIELGATPVKTKNLNWNVTANWSKNKSKVVSIKDGIGEITFYDEGRILNKLVVGGSAGDLYGTAYRRNEDGQLLIKADGFPDYTPTFVKAGNALPDWTANLNNTITYKNLSLSFVLEWKEGGDMFDVTMRNSIRNGVLKITENRYQQTIFDGVKIADGKANDIPVILDHNFYRNTNYFNNITDVILQDASWLRLRNVSLSYDLSKTILNHLKWIAGVQIGVTASNIILWTPYSGYDPGSTAFSAGYNVYGFTGSNIPNYSSLIFNLNVNF